MRSTTPMAESTRRYTVPALEKGLNMLLMLGAHRGEMSFGEIRRRMDVPKASAYRTVQTLEQMGFLSRGAGGYGLGIGVLRLGFDYLSTMDLVQIAQPVLHRLRDATGCSANLCVLDGRDVVYVARAGAIGEIGAGIGVGSRLPAHCTAIGRVLLMDLPAQRVRALFPEPLFAQTSEQGPDTPDELLALLMRDRACGYTVSESFYQPGVCAIAYPLRDRDGAALASVSVMVPRASLPADWKEHLRGKVAKAAADIESFLHATR